MADLSVRLGPLTLRNPFIVGSGPTVRNLDQIRRAEDAGWAAASLKLTIDPFPYISLPPRYRWFRRQRLHIFTAEKRLPPAEGLRLMEQARKATKDILLFPNITYDGEDIEGWARLARRFEEAGAHGIELNMCCPNMSYNLSTTGERTTKATGASLGSDLVELPKTVRAVTEAVKVPVIVKLTPEGGRIAQAAYHSLKAGAAAVGGVGNRLGIPDIDIRNPMGTVYRLQEGITLGCLSGPWIRPLALRDTYEMRCYLGKDPFLIASGGVSDMESAVQQIMMGADAVWICTETMIRGFSWMEKTLESLHAYMAAMGFHAIRDMRDLLLPNVKSADQLTIHGGFAVVDGDRCSHCGMCWELGHCAAISHPEGTTVIDRGRCRGCSTCVDVCPRGAITMTRA
jgi:dihydroorotate dehydrogenase/Pyruvate/2-oxoacid:ferredoxin oxidoreductase delta subunit